ncbi:unnamed protein product [Callosobruchus maculatus]|uniref:Methuselah N-terminal domain-containing protein n=1 Tax=Callosobruchus maculatus TaxID=64391 RepID=A0A653BJE9_CALMS|nr:unnamed protein product [Callosobruchus maculatus]
MLDPRQGNVSTAMKVIVILVTCACFVHGDDTISTKNSSSFFVILNHNTNETCEENSTCIRKCCEEGMAMKNKNCTTSDVEFSFSVYDTTQEVSEGNFTFDVVHGKSCTTGRIQKVDSTETGPAHYYVQRNGTLYCPQFRADRVLFYEDYCLENIIFPTHVEFVALLCYRDSDYRQVEETSGYFVNDAKELCKHWERVNISDVVRNRGEIVKDGVRYTPEDYFQENGTTWGCICHVKKCVRKCCESHKKVWNGTKCVQDFRDNFQLTFYENVAVVDSASLSDFEVVFGAECAEDYVHILPDTDSDIYVQTDGSLYVQSFDYTYDYASYCVDVFEDGEISALLCERYESGTAELQKTIYAKDLSHRGCPRRSVRC